MPLPNTPEGFVKRQVMIEEILKLKNDFGIETARQFVFKHTREGGKIYDIPEEKYAEVTSAAKARHDALAAARDAH